MATSFKLEKDDSLNLSPIHMEKSSIANNDIGTTAEGGKYVGEDESEIYLRKGTRPKLLPRNRKTAGTNVVQTTRSSTPNPQMSSLTGSRYRSKTWCKPTSVRQPLISAGTFVRSLARQDRKWSAPTTLQTNNRQVWR